MTAQQDDTALAALNKIAARWWTPGSAWIAKRSIADMVRQRMGAPNPVGPMRAKRDPQWVRAARTLRAMAKVSGGEVIVYRSRGIMILAPAGERRDLKMQTIAAIKGEPFFRRATFYELWKSPMMCERIEMGDGR